MNEKFKEMCLLYSETLYSFEKVPTIIRPASDTCRELPRLTQTSLIS